ncbi:MAG: helix-turn-helix transcriptional regulator [Bacteroidales bacterium]|nr:helix-turn-helix transcriptional regulator [Bacteroidales bacterium]
MTEIKEVHIGQLVKSVFDSSGMSVSELARRLHCERPNVYSIFSRYNMDVGLLVSLSKVLNHNFLDDIMKLYGLDARSAQLSVHISINNFTPEQMVRLTELLDEFKQK